jgi:hypothetical protein
LTNFKHEKLSTQVPADDLGDNQSDNLERDIEISLREHVRATFAVSLEEFDSLYRELAK